MIERGQVTIFVILALFVAISFLLIFFISNNAQKSINFQISPVNNYVESCLENSLLKSLEFFGTQNINFNSSEEGLKLPLLSIPYFYYLGENRMPSVMDTELLLAEYSNIYFDECITNFSRLEEDGFIINVVRDKKIIVKIKPENVIITLNYPLSVKRDDQTYQLDDFNYESNFDLLSVHQTISKFIEIQNNDPDYIPFGYIGVMSSNKNLNVKMSDFPENTVIYTFEFEDIILNNDKYIVLFGVKYLWDDKKKILNNIILDNEKAYVGEPFYYKLAPKFDDVKFTDYSSLININPTTGEIIFTPEEIDIGNHTILVKVFMDKEEEFYKLNLEVLKK